MLPRWRRPSSVSRRSTKLARRQALRWVSGCSTPRSSLWARKTRMRSPSAPSRSPRASRTSARLARLLTSSGFFKVRPVLQASAGPPCKPAFRGVRWPLPAACCSQAAATRRERSSACSTLPCAFTEAARLLKLLSVSGCSRPSCLSRAARALRCSTSASAWRPRAWRRPARLLAARVASGASGPAASESTAKIRRKSASASS
mmetsp:Transcript_22843/g.64733  ORF Transcript_22843/g.64733 Transcript_22843/m.64733 type:complete len:203 (-) Transcript_22843:236-844(-)